MKWTKRMIGGRATVAVGAAGAFVLAYSGGCTSPAPPNGGASASGPPPAAPAVEPVSAAEVVELAALRERALAEIETAAVDEWAMHRANALEALEQVPRRAVPWVRRGLQDRNPGVRSVAAMVAGRTGMAELDAELRSREDDPDPRVELSVLFALLSIGEKVDRSPIAAALFNPDDPLLRSYAAFILGELGDASALPMLRQAVNAPMPRADAGEVSVMRQQIAEAMVKLGDTGPLQGLRAALYPSRAEDLEQTALAVQIIGTVEDRGSIGQLIYLSATRDGERFLPPEVRLGIAQALGRMGRVEGAFLADEYAGHPEAAVREQAAHVYGWTLDPSDPGRLVAMLDDPAMRVRLAAAAGVVRVTTRALLVEVR